MEASAVFNPGAALVGDEVLLLLRVEDRRGLSHLRVARSRNGVDDWRIAKEPLWRLAFRIFLSRNGAVKTRASPTWKTAPG